MKVMALEPRLFTQEFVLLETKNDTIINTFNDNDVPISYEVYKKEGIHYYVLYIKFKKKYTNNVIEILKNVKNKLLLTGYTDYNEQTNILFKSIFGDSTNGIIEI